jgi:hypothetical protein
LISWTTEPDKGAKGWTVVLDLSQWQTPMAQIAIHLHPPDGRRLNTASAGQIVGSSVVIPANAVGETKQLTIQVS